MTDEERATKEKDDVKAMIGAMSAMQGAHRRIVQLEEVLKSLDYLCDRLQIAIGEKLYMDQYDNGRWVPKHVHTVIGEYRLKIKQVL